MISSKLLFVGLTTLCLHFCAAQNPPKGIPEHSLPECSPCNSSMECQSGICTESPGKCVEKDEYKYLVKCGLKKECESCTKTSQCATKECWSPRENVGRLCTFSIDHSLRKCFPNEKAKDCSPCLFHSECESGNCYGSPARCVKNTNQESLKECGFKEECEKCDEDNECASKRCWTSAKGFKSRCIETHSGKNKKESEEKCFSNEEKKLCALCSTSAECASKRCWGSPKRCISTGGYEELKECGFKKECEVCARRSECSTRKCSSPRRGMQKKCIFSDSHSSASCFEEKKLKDCASCIRSSSCGSGNCWGSPSRCVPVKPTPPELVVCGFKKHCESCRTSGECSTRLCNHHQCVKSRDDESCDEN